MMIPKKVIPFILGVILFTDPIIFFRVFLGNDILGLSLIFIFIAILFMQAQKKTDEIKLKNVNLIFGAYLFISVLVRGIAGVNFGNFVYHIVFLAQIILILKFSKTELNRTYLLKAFIIASFFHFIAIIPMFSWLQTRLEGYTAYSQDAYSIGYFSRRATGFFPAPGYLVVYSSGLLMLGGTMIKDNKKYVIILLIGFLLGLSTLNRSFLVVVFFLLIILLLNTSITGVWKLTLLLPFVILLLIANNNYLNKFSDSYSSYIESRFKRDSFSNNSRISGKTGIGAGWEGVMYSPVVGSASSLDGGALQGWNGEMYIQPHLGVLHLLVMYGGVFGGLLVLIILIVLKSISVKAINSLSNRWYFFVSGFILINILCLVEPLIETTTYVYFFLGCYIYFMKKENCENII